MKNLLILILTLFTISCSAQGPTPTGFTRYYSNVAYNGIWPMIYGAAPLGDTMVTVKGKGQMVQDSLTGTVWHVVSLTGKRWEPMGGGAGTGVTSVGMSIGGSAMSISPSSTSSSATFSHTWNGTSSQYVTGAGGLSNFANDVQTTGDARYSLLGHTHTFSQITDGPTAVGNLFNAGPGLTYDPTTRTYTASGSSVVDGILQGGVVTWSGTGLVFDVTSAKYVLGGSQYTSPASQVTLDPADASYGRWDAIIVTNAGTVSKITGTPASSPVLPQSDPASQIILTYVFIDAGATTPTQVSNEVIYDENIEWSHSTSGSVTANFASTTYAEQGTKSISATWTSASNLIFTNGSVLSAGNYTTISFYVRLSGGITNNTNVSVQFYNSANPVSNSVTSSISKSTTGSWQLVSFNISQFSFTSTSFNSVRLILTGSTVGTLGSVTVYFDNLRLQAGITPPTTVQGLQSAYTKVTDGTTIAAATGSDQLRFRSADNKLSIAVANNDATYGDNVLFTINQGNLSLSSIGGSLNVAQINATGGATGKVLSYDGTWVTNGGGTPGIDDVLAVGQSLTTYRTLQTGTNYLNIDGSGTYTSQITNSSSGTAIYAQSATGYAIKTFTNSTVAQFQTRQSSSSTIVPVIEVQRRTFGTAAAGLGGSIDFYLDDATPTTTISNQLVSKWIDASSGLKTSVFEIWGVNAGASSAKVIGIPSAIGNYANNAAALSAGLTAGDIYRNGDALMIVH